MKVASDGEWRISSIRLTRGPAWGLLFLAFISISVILLAMTTGSSGPPPERVLCDTCHDDFHPFRHSVDAPAEVPQGEVFEIIVNVRNDGEHQVHDLTARIGVLDAEGLVIEGGEPSVEVYNQDGTLGFRSSNTRSIPVEEGAVGATFSFSAPGGLLDSVDMVVTGPEGGSWAVPAGSSGSVDLDIDDIQEGGYGPYDVTLTHVTGVRQVSYTIEAEVEYGLDYTIQDAPDLAPGEDHTFTFKLRGVVQGTNGVDLAVSCTAYHDHMEAGHDEQAYGSEDILSFEVGDELVGGNGGSGGGGSDGGLLTAGQALGFLSAVLLAISVATSGHLPKLPRRAQYHCWSSYALAGTFIVHWTLLWAGPYGSTLGGIGTGSVMLLCILFLAVSGARPDLVDGKVADMPWKRLHRYVTYLLLAVLVAHALLNGSHFA